MPTLSPLETGDRITIMNSAPRAPERRFVLYWMIAARRTSWNHALDLAIAEALRLNKPLLVLEPLRRGYRWASPRLHRFVMEGMRANAAALEAHPVTYYPYVEPVVGEGAGLLEALSAQACVVVTDHYPCFFLPRMVEAAAKRLDVALIAVDSNGMLPLAAPQRAFTTAASFRRHLQKTILPHLDEAPAAAPFEGKRLPARPTLDPEWTDRWPPFDTSAPGGIVELIGRAGLVGESGSAATGGSEEANTKLEQLLNSKLNNYADSRQHPDTDPSSGLSPYLHFGHISSHAIFDAIADAEGWPGFGEVAPKATGSRAGWWGMSTGAEAFIDQLLTWRELGYVFAHQNPRLDERGLDALPDWAMTTLDAHRDDVRPTLYTLEQLDDAETHDPIWNAAQRQLRTQGVMHNYLRMLWGKKILEWSQTPEEALEIALHLNNAYALDGRDPNSYSGILWTFGLFDRAWGPERPIFGKVRYMSSDSTRRKLKLQGYLARYAKM